MVNFMTLRENNNFEKTNDIGDSSHGRRNNKGQSDELLFPPSGSILISSKHTSLLPSIVM